LLRKEKSPTDFGEIKAFLGEGTEFKGTLFFEGTVRIDGRLEGEIVSQDLLIVGEPAFIKAQIEVGTVVNSGKIVGSICAKKKVELLPPSRVVGTIKTPALIIAEGATFNGNCEMGGPEETPQPLALGEVTPEGPVGEAT